MSIYPFLLPGWEELSTWGADDDLASGTVYFYAQLTRDGHSDDDGPEFWISPPKHPPYANVAQLAGAICRVSGADAMTVLQAMSASVDPHTRGALGLPDPTPPAAQTPAPPAMSDGRPQQQPASRPTAQQPASRSALRPGLWARLTGRA